MPTYLNKDVPDTYLQGLIGAYRDGYKTVAENVEDGDQVIIDRLAAALVITQQGATDLGIADAQKALG